MIMNVFKQSELFFLFLSSVRLILGHVYSLHFFSFHYALYLWFKKKTTQKA